MYRKAEEYLSKWFHNKHRKPLILRGARQVGKTELVRRFSKNNNLKLIEINLEKYLYLDNVFKTLSIDKILKEIEGITHHSFSDDNIILFLDEIQAVPHALQALRYFYEEKSELPVIAAGSLLEFSLKDHNFSMPVGRVEYFYLGPFTFKEYLMEIEPELIKFIENYHIDVDIPESIHKKLLERQLEYIYIGGMPEAILIYSEYKSLQEVSRIHESILNTYYDDFSKYSKSKDLMLIQNIYNQLPRQIGNKVKYSNFSRDDRSKDVKNAINLLNKAKLSSFIYHSHCSGIPLNADINDKIFKIIFLDIGLANHRCGLDWLALTSYDEISFINQGSIAEQFIGQHLLYRAKGFENPVLHYWLREEKKSNAELDFVLSRGNVIVPIEVKAGKKGTLKSLFQFVFEKKVKFAIRFDLNMPSLQKAEHVLINNIQKHNVHFKLLSLPLYLVEETIRLIDELRVEKKI